MCQLLIFLPHPYTFYILYNLEVIYKCLMGIGAGEWDIEVPIVDDAVLRQRREDIFVQLGLGLISYRYERVADRLATIFDDPKSPEENRQYAINQLRSLIVESSMSPNTRMPTLGNVLGKAYELADEEQSNIPSLVQKYVEKHRPSPAPLTLGRRTPPAAVEVA